MEFPHHYDVHARARAEGDVTVGSAGLPDLATAAPTQFGGPGDRWSPETLLVAAAADCFILSFRASAGMSKLDFVSLECEAHGVLDRVDKVMRFTEMALRATLVLPAGASADRGRRLLEMAERHCLVTNSLALEATLECDVRIEGES